MKVDRRLIGPLYPPFPYAETANLAQIMELLTFYLNSTIHWSNRQSKTSFSRKFPSLDHHTWSNCAQKPSKDELYIATAANHHQTHHQRRPIRTSINLHFYLYRRAANPQKVCYFRSLNAPPPPHTHPTIISLESPASTRHNQACRRVPSGAVSVNPRSNNVTIKRSILEIGRF